MKRNKMRLMMVLDGITYDTKRAKLVYEEPPTDGKESKYYATRNGHYFEVYRVVDNCYNIRPMTKFAFDFFTKTKPIRDAEDAAAAKIEALEEDALPF